MELNGLNKGIGLRFCVDSLVQQETPEDGQRMHWPKHYEYKDEDNSPNDKKNCKWFLSVIKHTNYLQNITIHL